MSKTKKTSKKAYKASRRTAKNKRSTRKLSSSSFSNISSLTNSNKNDSQYMSSEIPSMTNLRITSSINRNSNSRSRNSNSRNSNSRSRNSRSRNSRSLKHITPISNINLASIPDNMSVSSDDFFKSIDQHGSNFVKRPTTLFSSSSN